MANFLVDLAIAKMAQIELAITIGPSPSSSELTSGGSGLNRNIAEDRAKKPSDEKMMSDLADMKKGLRFFMTKKRLFVSPIANNLRKLVKDGRV